MKLKYDFSVQEVADMFVAIAKNRETQTVEQVFTLNETGALILKALQEDKGTTAIVDLLLSQYDVNRDQAITEVSSFINMLKDKGLEEE